MFFLTMSTGFLYETRRFRKQRTFHYIARDFTSVWRGERDKHWTFDWFDSKLSFNWKNSWSEFGCCMNGNDLLRPNHCALSNLDREEVRKSLVGHFWFQFKDKTFPFDCQAPWWTTSPEYFLNFPKQETVFPFLWSKFLLFFVKFKNNTCAATRLCWATVNWKNIPV